MTRRYSLVTVGLSLGLAACGQNNAYMVAESPAASAVQDPVIQDVPKPAGFELVDERSVARASGKFRVAKCEYVGNMSRATVKRFYEEYMPSAGFELRDWSLYNGEFDLRFESAAEVCSVRIGPEGSRTRVVIDIGPRPQGPVGREAKPPMRRPD